MKTVKDKQILMAADFAGYPLKEAISGLYPFFERRISPNP